MARGARDGAGCGFGPVLVAKSAGERLTTEWGSV
jgi:hypothetical protein